MAYVDGFLIPVPTARKAEYRAHEAQWFPWFRDRGALSLVVLWGDDVRPGRWTDFRRAVALEEGETVVLAWMVWPDKATRDRAFAAAETDPGMGEAAMPFDGRRLVYGGFEPLLALGTAPAL